MKNIFISFQIITDIVLSPDRTQSNFLRWLARLRFRHFTHATDYLTIKLGDERSVGTLSIEQCFYLSACSGLPRQVVAQCLINAPI